jgi:hypothetical protein
VGVIYDYRSRPLQEQTESKQLRIMEVIYIGFQPTRIDVDPPRGQKHPPESSTQPGNPHQLDARLYVCGRSWRYQGDVEAVARQTRALFDEYPDI